MRAGRTLPPAASPFGWSDLGYGAAALLAPQRALRRLEDQLRRHFGVTDVFLVSSGTAALTLTLMALKSLSPRTDVIIPAYTCFSVPAAVLKAGLRPVPCDINPSNFDYDHAQLERALKSTTLCVVVHHLFGVASDVEQTLAMCRARRIFVVEDAAQAMGLDVDGRPLGTLGDAGIFSLGRGKHLTCGSGGIVVTSSRQIAGAVEQLYAALESPSVAASLKDFLRLALMAVLIHPRLYWIPASLPFLRLGETIFPKTVALARLSAWKAGFLRNWRNRLARANAVRCETVGYYLRHLPLPTTSPAKALLRLPILAANRADRERLHRASRCSGFGLARAYPTTVSDIPEVRAASFAARKSFPKARDVVDRLLTIPTHELLSERDKREITVLCRSAFATHHSEVPQSMVTSG